MKTPDIEKSRINPPNAEESNFYKDFVLSMDGKSVYIIVDEKDLPALLGEPTAASIKNACIIKLALSFFRVFWKIPDDKSTGLGLAELLFQRNEQIMTLIEDDKFRVFVREKLPPGS